MPNVSLFRCSLAKRLYSHRGGSSIRNQEESGYPGPMAPCWPAKKWAHAGWKISNVCVSGFCGQIRWKRHWNYWGRSVLLLRETVSFTCLTSSFGESVAIFLIFYIFPHLLNDGKMTLLGERRGFVRLPVFSLIIIKKKFARYWA